MSEGIAHEFFDTQDKQSKQKLEEDRLLAHITKAKSVKEAETIAYLNEPPKSSPRGNVPPGPELAIEWVDANGDMKMTIRIHVDHVFRLPLQTLCDTWNIKNVRFFEGNIPIKPMFDGFSDLSIFDRSATVVKLLADPMTAEDQEEAKRKRRPSVSALPRRTSTGALPTVSSSARRPSVGTVPELTVSSGTATGATSVRKPSIGAAPNNQVPVNSVRRPSVGSAALTPEPTGNSVSARKASIGAAINNNNLPIRRPSQGASETTATGRRPSVGSNSGNSTQQPARKTSVGAQQQFAQPAPYRKTSIGAQQTQQQPQQQPTHQRKLSNAGSEVSNSPLNIRLTDEERQKREKMEEDRLWAQIGKNIKQ